MDELADFGGLVVNTGEPWRTCGGQMEVRWRTVAAKWCSCGGHVVHPVVNVVHPDVHCGSGGVHWTAKVFTPPIKFGLVVPLRRGKFGGISGPVCYLFVQVSNRDLESVGYPYHGY